MRSAAIAAVGVVMVWLMSGCGGPSVTVIATNETTALRETYAFSPVDVTIPTGGTVVLKNPAMFSTISR